MTLAGPVLRSTAGGRSVVLAIARLQAATLRTLPLVAVPQLLALTDPLAALRAGPPRLEQLGQSVDRASGDHGASPGPSRQRAAAREPVASVRATRATEAVRAVRPPDPGPLVRGPEVSGPAGVPAPAGHPRRPAPPWHLRPAASPTAAPASRAVGSAPPTPGMPGHERTPTVPAIPAAPPVELDLGALSRAARAEVTPAPVYPPQHAATSRASLLGPPGPGPGPTFVAPAGGTVAGFAPLGPTSTDPVPVGALRDLLSRWDTASAAAGPAPTPAADAGAHTPSAFAPLSCRLVEHARTADLGDGPGDATLSLDNVELALDALLRREAEQHGLECGLG